jgi:SAM-dependent methyltransferase
MHTTPNNKIIYDKNWDAWFDQKVYGPASRWLRWLIECNLDYIDPITISKVIDIGCGQGTTTALISKKFPIASILGTDFSRTGIAAATRHYGSDRLQFVVDESSQHLEPSSFDLVTCFEVLEHVYEWQALLERICSASQRYVMLSFPTGRMRKFESTVGHVRNFRAGEVERFMTGVGFLPVNLYYAGFPFYSPLYRDLCNLMDAGHSNFASGRFGLRQRALSSILFTSFRYLSARRVGDQFCGLFVRG